MPPRRTRAVAWNPEMRDQSLDGMFASMRDEAVNKLGTDVSIGTEADALVVGLPLPALCLRFLFQSTVYPLSRIIQITGEEGSCKSAFQFEMMRWHHVYGGGSVFIENESKDSPTLRHSILEWRQDWLRRHEVIKTYAMEDWMDALTAFTSIARNQQDAQGGPGHTIPIMFSVDSLTATSPREELEKIAKEGHTARTFALGANLISMYMKYMPATIKTYPFTICGTNHLKPTTDFMGRRIGNVPGGKSVKFMETYEVEMSRAPSPDIDLLEYGGIRCKLTTRKNGLGPSRKSIMADLLWWQEDVDGRMRQRTAWDWDKASVDLLLSFSKINGKKTLSNYLNEICHIIPKNKREAKCPTLGINDYVEYRQIGAALEQRPDLLAEIYRVLGIEEHNVFQPGVDYRDLLAHAREAAAQATANLYQHPEDLPVLDPDVLDPSGTALTPMEIEDDEESSE